MELKAEPEPAPGPRPPTCFMHFMPVFLIPVLAILRSHPVLGLSHLTSYPHSRQHSLDMNKWAPIAPTKSGGAKGGLSPVSPNSGGMLSSFGAVLKPSKAGPSTSAAAMARAGRTGPRVGRWPEDIIVRIVGFLPVHDVPAFARANRALARIARDEGTWEARCRVMGISEPGEGVWAGGMC